MEGVWLDLGAIMVRDTHLPFNLGSFDVILEMQWLEKCVVVSVNWKE